MEGRRRLAFRPGDSSLVAGFGKSAGNALPSDRVARLGAADVRVVVEQMLADDESQDSLPAADGKAENESENQDTDTEEK